MQKVLFFFLFTGVSVSLYGQQLQGQAVIDSMVLEAVQAVEDSNLVKTLSLLASASLIYQLPTDRLEYAENALQLTNKLCWNRGKGYAYTGMGAYHLNQSQPVKAIAFFQMAETIFEEEQDLNGLSQVYFHLSAAYEFGKPQKLEFNEKSIALCEAGHGSQRTLSLNYYIHSEIYRFRSDYSNALKYVFKALNISENINDLYLIADNLQLTAIIYYDLRDFQKSLEYEFRAIEIYEQLGFMGKVANSLGNIGLTYNYMGMFDKALEYTQRSMKKFDELNDYSRLGTNHLRMGNILLNLDNFSDALYHYSEARAIEEKAGDITNLCMLNHNMGAAYYSFYLAKKEEGAHPDTLLLLQNKTLHFLQEATQQFGDLGMLRHKITNLRGLSEVLVEFGDYAQALEYYKKFKTLQDSIFSVEKSTAIANLEAKRENELKDREIALLSSEKQVQFLKLEGKKAQLALQNLESARQMQAIDLLHKDNEIYLLDLSRKDQELLLSQMTNEAQATQLELANLEREVKEAQLLRQKTIQQSMLAGFGVVLLAGIVLFFFLMYRRRAKFREKVAVTELKALRAQMNPHFMFNALGSIHNFVMQNNNEKASAYLLKFSRLMRIILESSMKENIPLEDEIEALEIYMQLEAARMQHKFTFDFAISDKIDRSNTMIPPLLIQPFLENAIWHGVSNRSSPGHVSVKISKQGDILHCEIVDNGIGRKKAMEIKHKQVNKRESVGIKLTLERIEIINRQKRTKGGVSFTDLEEGLRVAIDLPMEEMYNEN